MSLPGSGTAKACFDDNIRLFAYDPLQQPEKYNLYNGLSNLALAINQIEDALHSIDYRLTVLEKKVR